MYPCCLQCCRSPVSSTLDSIPYNCSGKRTGTARVLGFPGVNGAFDCTHIAITTPCEHEEQYFNHHGYHFMNVQVVAHLC
uniref:DDE Tnp4 domain-containing protein n=1 Tax=Timema tahoe TaxID=61484 RepID=A0A7R9IK88_9NEOP|nr:unnamed protein product [Timema tahoe]